MDASVVGTTALWAAVALSTGSVVLRGVAQRRTIGLAVVAGVVAVLTLVGALVGTDFSLEYVARTTSRATPTPYRVAALWGGMEGSMLFYAVLTLVVGYLALRRRRSDAPIRVVAIVSALMLLFTVGLVSPFQELAIPAVDGDGLLAILQHPAMIYHPPVLYLGLTSLVIPAALTMAAVARREDDEWLGAVRKWMLVSWALLALGMVFGANWAYVELGWGGFWAWDPVENTALMPWLAATAFLHVARITRRDGRLRSASVALALIPFALTVLGVYLTRSGVTGSIHAFAEDPLIGRIILIAAAVGLVVSTVTAFRASPGEKWERVGSGRDTWLAGSGVLLALALVFVTIGSAYPAYRQVFEDEAVTVGPRFFLVTTIPIACLIALTIGFALRTTWRSAQLTTKGLLSYGGVAVLIGITASIVDDEHRWLPTIILALSGGAIVLLLVDSIHERRPARLGAHLAHLGIMMVILGSAGSALGGDIAGVMAPGDEVTVSGRTLTLVRIETGESDRFVFVRADFDLDGRRTMGPEIRGYEDQGVPVSEPALVSGAFQDVIVAISRFDPGANSVDVSVFVRPLVWWVWAGAVVMSVGGLLALVGRAGDDAVPRRAARAGRQQAGTTI